MDALRYLTDIIEPTIKEYAADRTSLRRGFMTCVATFRIVDYLEPGQARAMRRDCPGFKVVDRVAHAFKHAATGHRNSEIAPLRVDDVVSRPPAFVGQFRVGLSWIGDSAGG